MRLPRALFCLCLLGLAWATPPAGRAENPAPSIHWGALGYPDRERTLMAGATFNRFTEFNADADRYNNVQETAGFNFATVSWTERLRALKGVNTNLTIGAGPTRDEPTATFQNGLTHRLFSLRPVPRGRTRDTFDFMASGTVTKWGDLFGQPEIGFGGVGFASGSLYHEVYAQLGLRRVAIGETLGDYVRFSAMGRSGLLYGGSAYHQVANQSSIGQVSFSLGNYKGYDPSSAPRWELEVGYTFDSGLFVHPDGDAIAEQFITAAVRFPYGKFEVWNDFIGYKDSGPTYGTALTFDLFQIGGAGTRDRVTQ